ncbi:MAG TPA: SUF system Fe-S cluster assembly regulator [Gammaproteobacteria bacterium]|nr:SUF system Fe-S cluster assembly regulator [Gammaproteobacteria bacterium]
MLRISKLADYATVIMHHLAVQPDQWVSASEIAEQVHLAIPTVSKILKMLCEASLVISARGTGGGYKLGKPASAISVAEVVTAIEGKPSLTECAQGAQLCVQEGVCAVKHNWRAINRFVFNTLQNVTLADMAQPLSLPAALFPSRAKSAVISNR